MARVTISRPSAKSEPLVSAVDGYAGDFKRRQKLSAQALRLGDARAASTRCRSRRPESRGNSRCVNWCRPGRRGHADRAGAYAILLTRRKPRQQGLPARLRQSPGHRRQTLPSAICQDARLLDAARDFATLAFRRQRTVRADRFQRTPAASSSARASASRATSSQR